jgi:hypothetical protein
MSAAAKPLGFEIVAAERRLAEPFASGSIVVTYCGRRPPPLPSCRGKLRAVHLAAHLETRVLLSPEQIARYDVLRGLCRGRPAAGSRSSPAQRLTAARMREKSRFRFLKECSGACGDLGTFIPHTMGAMVVAGLAPWTLLSDQAFS